VSRSQRVRAQASNVANAAGAVVFPAAGIAVIVSAAFENGLGWSWWGAECAAALTSVLAYLGAKLEGWRREQRIESLEQTLGGR
jgi:hypothetical protein